MPSPLAHSAMGYLIYRLADRRLRGAGKLKIASLPMLLIATLVFSLLPDLDSVAGILVGDFGGYHNNWTHSLMTGLAVAFLVGMAVWLKQRSGFLKWFMIPLLSYEAHVIMDFFTTGRGVMLLWPLSTDRFSSPLLLFYGLHWSEGLFSIKHLWTIATESIFVLLILVIVQLIPRMSFIDRGQSRRKVETSN